MHAVSNTHHIIQTKTGYDTYVGVSGYFIAFWAVLDVCSQEYV